jgi:acyl-CoA hydrolase
MAEAKQPSRAEPRTVSRSRSELIRWMSIQDANSAGMVHGGVVMRMCDEAAGIAAIRHSGCRVVTAGVDRMTFLNPVHVGELLRCVASVNAVWRTSMEVGVRVEAENAVTGEVRATSTAYLTMVAVDENGKPVPVPPLQVKGAVEERRQREAETRRRNRLKEREEILEARRAADGGTAAD